MLHGQISLDKALVADGSFNGACTPTSKSEVLRLFCRKSSTHGLLQCHRNESLRSLISDQALELILSGNPYFSQQPSFSIKFQPDERCTVQAGRI